MPKTISIINAGNVYAQTFLKSIAGYNRIILGDCVNSRRSFLRTVNGVRKLDPNVQVDHMNINSSILLEESIKNADTVVYFTHDYYAFVAEKNEQLRKTAEICKAYNVNKLIAINPIEFVNYFSNGFNEDPLAEETKAQEEALKTFQNTTILRTNLGFGTNSYLVRFLTQNWTEDYSPFDLSGLKHYRFNPIYNNDLNDIIQMLVTDESNSLKGKKLIANGTESLSIADVDSMIKQTYSQKKEHVVANRNLQKLLFNWQIFFHGNTHITNMHYMLNFLHNSSSTQFSGYENAAQALGVKPKSFREYYTHKAEKFDDRVDTKVDHLLKGEEPTDLRFPKIQNYWNLSLD